MLVNANEPKFLPWVGYWHGLLTCDVFIDMVHTQYVKGDYYNRVKVNGEWLTVPVLKSFGKQFIDVKFDIDALPKIAAKISRAYIEAPYRNRIDPIVTLLLNYSSTSLITLNLALRDYIAYNYLEVDLTKMVVNKGGEGATTQERLWDMIKTTVPEITGYLSGAGGKEYLKTEFPIPTFMQDVHHTYGGNSILQILATEADPRQAILNAAKWEEWHP